MANQSIQNIDVEDLCLWTENPRDPIDTDLTDYDIISRAISDSHIKWKLNDFANEMGKHYDFSELPTVVNCNGKMVVFDGNRRVAVLKYLQNSTLYSSLGGGLFFDSEPVELKSLTQIPCNVCDKETALTNIERKHSSNGSWGILERDYFLYHHRQQPKSLFVKLEEQTGLISKHPKMNSRFVKEEVLTEDNLNDIGFALNNNGDIVSNYDKALEKEILDGTVDVIKKNIVSTRNNRGQLKNPLIQNLPSLRKHITTFDEKKPSNKLDIKPKKPLPKPRPTPTTKKEQVLFGGTLCLTKGNVNDLYRAVDRIYKTGNKDHAILQIVAMSLRLLLEVAAREIMPELIGQDQIYRRFINKAKKDILAQKQINFFSLTDDPLCKVNDLANILDKYAHGNIVVSRCDVLNSSEIVGDIISFYFGKNK